MKEAQLYWDVGDDSHPGWTLRWRDANGTEHTRGIDAAEDDGVEALAEAVESQALNSAAGLLGATGKIAVFRGVGGQPGGTITLRDGEIVRVRS